MKTLTMKERRQLLVDALKSGKYKQDRVRLQSDIGYCCLGVACRVAEKQGVNVNLDKFGLLEGGNLQNQEAVKNYFGFSCINGQFLMPNGVTESLVMINDVDESSFKEIAKVIASEPEGMFIAEDN